MCSLSIMYLKLCSKQALQSSGRGVGWAGLDFVVGLVVTLVVVVVGFGVEVVDFGDEVFVSVLFKSDCIAAIM